jgi:hypothetical protein
MVKQIKILMVLVDDSIVIKSFITDDGKGYKKEPTKENIAKEIERAIYTVKHWEIIDDELLDKLDREFRETWCYTKDEPLKLTHDIEKVKKIHLDRLRVKRAKILQDKDSEWIQAMAKGDQEKAKEIERDKQKLRDFPITIEKELKKAKTIEEIKLINPFK